MLRVLGHQAHNLLQDGAAAKRRENEPEAERTGLIGVVAGKVSVAGGNSK
jgi:hypothetical protein